MRHWHASMNRGENVGLGRNIQSSPDLSPHSKIDPYITSGFGVYHVNLSLTEPFNETVFSCDPFFGFCFRRLRR